MDAEMRAGIRYFWGDSPSVMYKGPVRDVEESPCRRRIRNDLILDGGAFGMPLLASSSNVSIPVVVEVPSWPETRQVETIT